MLNKMIAKYEILGNLPPNTIAVPNIKKPTPSTANNGTPSSANSSIALPINTPATTNARIEPIAMGVSSALDNCWLKDMGHLME